MRLVFNRKFKGTATFVINRLNNSLDYPSLFLRFIKDMEIVNQIR